MDRRELHERVSALALEAKDMVMGGEGWEPDGTTSVPLDFMDAFTLFQFAVYLAEEFDVLLVEEVVRSSDHTTEKVTETVARALAEQT